jgi:parvulin-like peptidyl-prolyl isomerase
MRLFIIWLWMGLLPTAWAQTGAPTDAPPARPKPKLVLTNSLDAFTTPSRTSASTNPAGIAPNPAAVPSRPATLSTNGEAIWAEGEGLRITASAVGAKVSRTMAEAAAAGRTLTDRDLNALRGRTLDTMIFVQLVLRRADQSDTNRALFETKSRIDGLIKNAPSPEVFFKTLEQAGYTEESFRRETFEEALVVNIIDREVKRRIRIPDSDIQGYYDSDSERWKKPNQVKAAQIFFATINPETREKLPADLIETQRKKAQQALAQVKAGTNFATLARQVSEDPTSRERGGEYIFQKGQMFPEFEKAVWDMKPGTLHGEVVTTQFGFHVFQRLEDLPARVIPLTEVADQIRELLIQREMEVRIPEYGDRLRADAKVRLLPGAPQPFQP